MENAARARLDGWKQSLLAAADRLLDAADHGVEIAGDPVRLVFSLVGGSRYLIEPADVAGLEAGRIRVAMPAGELAAKVAGLRRAARDALADGEHVLWLAIGVLAWIDDDQPRAAPLVLWPMTLERDAAGITRLVAASDRAPRINRVLAARLAAKHGAVLDDQDGALALDLVRVLDRATAIAAERPGWRVERVARLGTFAFGPHELLADFEKLETSLPLRWLAGDVPAPALATGEPDIAPLDADASQTAVLAAAAAGGSVVVQGAPGTGKTQTIANLIAQCASRGTSVLVVARHKRALEAIRDRLDSVGLAELCGTSAPRAVPLTVSGPTVGAARLAEVTHKLERHVAAMHGTHNFGITIHDALARLVELRTTPNAALEELDAPALDRATFERRKHAAVELATAAGAVEPVAAHPWRASALVDWHGGYTARAANALDIAGEAATGLASAIVELAVLVPHVTTRTLDQLIAIGRLGELAAASPRPGAELLAASRGRNAADDIGERVALIRARGTGTLEAPRDPVAFVAIAQRHRALVAEVAESFCDASELAAGELWTQLKRWTTSMAPLRYVALRTARAHVHAAALPGVLETDAAMLVALEAVIAERACRAALVAAAEPARRWFGELGGDPLAVAVEPLEAALGWAAELRRAFDQVAIAGGEVSRQTAWRALVAQVTVATAGGDRADLVPFARLADAVARYQPTIAMLAEATGIPLAQLGAGHDHIAVTRTQVDALAGSVRALAEWTRYTLAKRAAIDAGLRAIVVAAERGDLHACDLALAWERATLLAWVASAIGRAIELVRFDGNAHHLAVTAFADLDRGAMAVARGRIPRHGACALATPSELARGDARNFDLVIFDDAHRLAIGDALGALARGTAMIAFGDSRQPGPSDGEPSLLDAALAAGMPELALDHHYASAHDDLFAFANRRYYGERVAVSPAARRGGAISWRRIDGEADALGGNRAEAEAIVADAIARVRNNERVAIACLSRAQQQLIEDLLDDERVKDRALADIAVATPDRADPCAVVLLSVGDTGALTEPHLAALTTRAREQLAIYSSFEPETIDATAPSAWRGLAELIGFARDGAAGVDEAPSSPVTAAIARALAERGWALRHRVGSVELAVVDPDDPSRCVLAIEHDGARYARKAPARDRDRLRAQELSRLGWRVHRLWTLDWWLDPERETQRAHGAIVAAVAAGRRARTLTPAPVSRITVPAAAAKRARRRVEAGGQPATPEVIADAPTAPVAAGSGPNTSPLHIARGAIAIGPYQAAAIPPGRRVPDDMFGGRHQAELGKVVEQVLAAEAPIHVELLARRVGAYFGVGRVTPDVLAQVRAAIDGRGRFGDEAEVVYRIDQDPAHVPDVRVAGANAVACRDIAQIPLFEIAAAARIVVERAAGLTATELARDTSRLLGFARITPRITERVDQGIRLAAVRELIALDNGRANPVTA
ncbi:MAG TPA: DUF3320 domain-containing protein [Kofleriaceae bacterium]|nr:DUF3320 domain-containing protein [Kofleriaceae bacterium]